MDHKVGMTVGLVAACVALAACTSGSSVAGGAASATTSSEPAAVSSSSAPPTTTPAATTSTPAPATSTPAPTTSRPTASKPATSKPTTFPLVLEPDGLAYVVGSSSIRQVPFGTDAATVKMVVGKALGGALTADDLPECGQGPRASAGRNGFTILLDGTTFVGWTDQGGTGRRFTTLDGVGVGSTFAAVKASRPGVTAETGSLGPEFTDTDGFGGILAGTSPKSKVTLLYAGETCFFR